jgi:hypothetical protein
MIPRYNALTFRIECDCKENCHFDHFQKYKVHTKTKVHQEWLKTNNISQETTIPICNDCKEPMYNPKEHQQVCIAKVDCASLADQFRNKMATMTETKATCCESCKTVLFLTTLSKARKWKDKVYCPSCFRTYFKESEKTNHMLLKTILLAQTDGKCALCTRNIIMQRDQVIYEHMNPFEKKTDPTACLRQGMDVSTVAKESLDQGIRLVHLLCAQIKTVLESNCHQIQSIKNLKKRKAEENQPNKMVKVQLYQEKILPSITRIIQTHCWKIHNHPK